MQERRGPGAAEQARERDLPSGRREKIKLADDERHALPQVVHVTANWQVQWPSRSRSTRAHRECSRSLLLELPSRAETDYPLNFGETLFGHA